MTPPADNSAQVSITQGAPNLQKAEWVSLGCLLLSFVLIYLKMAEGHELFLLSTASLFRGMGSK